MARLTTDFWVQAYRARLEQLNIPAFVTSRGDATAGAILVKLNRLNGTAEVYQRSYDLLADARTWVVLAEGPETGVDEAIERQKATDPDLWVIEVEDREGRHLLDAPGLSE